MYLSNSFGPNQRHRVDSGEYAGWLASPAGWGIAAGIRKGQPWAGDNGCFTDQWTARKFMDWLDMMEEYQSTCMWITSPDVLGDWEKTLENYEYWYPILSERGWPVAYVGQDWQPVDKLPWGTMACYFVGGTNEWKDTAESLAIVRECRKRGMPVHVGRVNTSPRLLAFLNAYRLDGEIGYPPNFTVDGNGWRMPGKKKELARAMATLKMERLL